MNKKPLPTIGVDKYTFFKVLSDDETGTTYDEATYQACIDGTQRAD